MITAVQESQLQQRHRARSAAAGPQFSMPAFTGMSDLMTASLPSAPACTPQFSPSVQAPSTPSTLDLGSYLGRSVGSGQCVALVRASNPALGPSSTWTAGTAVQGNLALSPGTPIATFDGASRYANALDGSSHAAIYLGQDAKGIQVLDQWAGSAAGVRTIPWDNPGGAPANTGSAFRVVRPAVA